MTTEHRPHVPADERPEPAPEEGPTAPTDPDPWTAPVGVDEPIRVDAPVLAMEAVLPAAADPSQQPTRPAAPGTRFGRAVRKIAGVDENVLDWVPEERSRYLALGLVILNTGLMAGFSLQLAIGQVVTLPWYVLAALAVLWAWLIICLDKAMISGAHGKLGSSRWRVLVPRLVVALAIGTLIAEPFVLRIFAPAIQQQVKDDRIATIGAYEDLLHRCNPVNAPRSTSAECRDNPVSVDDARPATNQRLGQAQTARDKLKQTLDGLAQQQKEQEGLAHDECTGTARAGTTGRAGIGLNCLQDRAELAGTTALYGQQKALLDQSDAELAKASDTQNEATRAFTTSLTQAIDKAIAERKATQGRIDLLDETAGLEHLSAHNWTVMAAQWLLRAVLVLLDCLPVLVKLMSGATAYDRRLARQIEVDEALHDAQKYLEERIGTSKAEIRLHRLEYEVRQHLASLEQADLDKQAREEAAVDARIEALAAKFRRQAAGVTDPEEPDHELLMTMIPPPESPWRPGQQPVPA